MNQPRLRGPALGIDCEIVRGYMFIPECIRYCYYHVMGLDELPSWYVGLSVLSDHWRPFLWIFPVIRGCAIGLALKSWDITPYHRIYRYIIGHRATSKDQAVGHASRSHLFSRFYNSQFLWNSDKLTWFNRRDPPGQYSGQPAFYGSQSGRDNSTNRGPNRWFPHPTHIWSGNHHR
jgi:hypothetical protein